MPQGYVRKEYTVTKTKLPEGIRLLPSGRFQARVKTPDGVRRAAGTFETLREAIQGQASKEEELNRFGVVDSRISQTTFKEFAEIAFAYRERSLKASTNSGQRGWLKNYLLPAFGDMRLKDIRPRHVDEWWSAFRGGKVTRQRCYAVLHAYMELARRWEYIPANPCMVKGGFADATTPRPAWGMPDFLKVLEHTDGMFRVAVLVAFCGHLRAGEVLGLNVGDFEPSTGVLHVTRSVGKHEGLTTTKNGDPKTVTLLDQGAQALRGHLKRYRAIGDAPMFAGPRGGRIKYKWLLDEWRSACKAAGLEDFHLHDIRHVSLTHIATVPGATLREIMARGGHRSVAVAMRYQSATLARDSEIAVKASAMLGRW